MKTVEQVLEEIKALERLAASVPDDAIAQASVAGQINALAWAAFSPIEDAHHDAG